MRRRQDDGATYFGPFASAQSVRKTLRLLHKFVPLRDCRDHVFKKHAQAITAKVNDVVWIEPPGRAPLVVAAYYDTNTVAEWPTDAQQAVLAAVGRVVARFA